MVRNLLKEYIKILISEEVMNKIEDQFTIAYQSAKENNKDPFKSMLNVASKRQLKQIGEGSSRIVFQINDNEVIKVARNQAGVEQNRLEAFAGRDAIVEDLLVGIERNSEDYSWVISKKVKPLDDMEFAIAEKIVGIPWNDVRKAVGLDPKSEYETTKVPTGTKKEKDYEEKGSKKCLRGQDFLKAVVQFTQRYEGMLLGDLTKLSSWGISPKGCLVILDYGITKKVYKGFYKDGVAQR